MKFLSFCLVTALFYVHLDGMSAEGSKNYIPDARECLGGISPSACNKRLLLIPFPRFVPREGAEPTFSRSQRVFGLVKTPRVGRSSPDPSWTRRVEDDTWTEEHSSGTPSRHPPASGEKEENFKNLNYYLPTQRRDSNAPWAFFLITPNYQSGDRQQVVDNLITQLEHESDDADEK